MGIKWIVQAALITRQFKLYRLCVMGLAHGGIAQQFFFEILHATTLADRWTTLALVSVR